MCNPAAILTMQAVGGAQQAIGAYGQAAGQRSSLRYDAQIAAFNVRMAEQSAQRSLERGRAETNAVRRNTAALKGQQRAGMAARGVDLTYGTPAEVLTSTDVMGELDAQTTQINAIREAWGYRAQATNFENEAAMATASAQSISPGLAASTSLLGSATDLASSFYGMRRQGAFGGSNRPVKATGRSQSRASTGY